MMKIDNLSSMNHSWQLSLAHLVNKLRWIVYNNIDVHALKI